MPAPPRAKSNRRYHPYGNQPYGNDLYGSNDEGFGDPTATRYGMAMGGYADGRQSQGHALSSGMVQGSSSTDSPVDLFEFNNISPSPASHLDFSNNQGFGGAAANQYGMTSGIFADAYHSRGHDVSSVGAPESSSSESPTNLPGFGIDQGFGNPAQTQYGVERSVYTNAGQFQSHTISYDGLLQSSNVQSPMGLIESGSNAAAQTGPLDFNDYQDLEDPATNQFGLANGVYINDDQSQGHALSGGFPECSDAMFTMDPLLSNDQGFGNLAATQFVTETGIYASANQSQAHVGFTSSLSESSSSQSSLGLQDFSNNQGFVNAAGSRYEMGTGVYANAGQSVDHGVSSGSFSEFSLSQPSMSTPEFSTSQGFGNPVAGQYGTTTGAFTNPGESENLVLSSASLPESSNSQSLADLTEFNNNQGYENPAVGQYDMEMSVYARAGFSRGYSLSPSVSESSGSESPRAVQEFNGNPEYPTDLVVSNRNATVMHPRPQALNPSTTVRLQAQAELLANGPEATVATPSPVVTPTPTSTLDSIGKYLTLPIPHDRAPLANPEQTIMPDIINRNLTTAEVDDLSTAILGYLWDQLVPAKAIIVCTIVNEPAITIKLVSEARENTEPKSDFWVANRAYVARFAQHYHPSVFEKVTVDVTFAQWGEKDNAFFPAGDPKTDKPDPRPWQPGQFEAPMPPTDSRGNWRCTQDEMKEIMTATKWRPRFIPNNDFVAGLNWKPHYYALVMENPVGWWDWRGFSGEEGVFGVDQPYFAEGREGWMDK